MAYSLVQLPVVSKVVRLYHERLTCRGQYLLWSMVVLAILGLDTRRTFVFWLFPWSLACSLPRLHSLCYADLGCILTADSPSAPPLPGRSRCMLASPMIEARCLRTGACSFVSRLKRLAKSL